MKHINDSWMDHLTEEQTVMAVHELPVMDEVAGRSPLLPLTGVNPFRLTFDMHQKMGFPISDIPTVISVSDRERRLRLIFEEFMELVDAMGFELKMRFAGAEGKPEFYVSHIEGSRCDLIECADALGDLNVTVNGTAVEMGLFMPLIDYEIYCSNMSKLDPESGKAILNRCSVCDPDFKPGDQPTQCEELTHRNAAWRDPTAPIGKGLKGPNYRKPNIPALLFAIHCGPKNKEGQEDADA